MLADEYTTEQRSRNQE